MLWQQCLQQLEQEVPDSEINTWLRALHAVEKRQALFLLAPNTIVLQQVHEQYLPRILFHSRIITGDNEFDVMLQIGSSVPTAPPPLTSLPLPQKETYLRQTPTYLPPPLTQVSPDWQDTSPLSVATNPAPISERFANALNPRMTFANFVEGKSNQLACATSQQVGDQPDTTYNPLFIYGGVGLGKTHLMHAIGNRILERDPGARVIYVYAERFVNDMISAIRNSRMEEFKRHYRSLDALLIDDIQFFAGKDRSMEEFFHTFNALLEGQKRIILASDKFPRDLEGIEDRLKTRFNWGLTVQIESLIWKPVLPSSARKLKTLAYTCPMMSVFSSANVSIPIFVTLKELYSGSLRVCASNASAASPWILFNTRCVTNWQAKIRWYPWEISKKLSPNTTTYA